MHELGIVSHVMKTIDELGEENNLTQVASVTVEIGEVSGVLPDYLQKCWGYANMHSQLLKDAKLIIETLPAETICDDCGAIYSTLEYKKICPKCKSEHTYLLHGNEFNIKEIEAC